MGLNAVCEETGYSLFSGAIVSYQDFTQAIEKPTSHQRDGGITYSTTVLGTTGPLLSTELVLKAPRLVQMVWIILGRMGSGDARGSSAELMAF